MRDWRVYGDHTSETYLHFHRCPKCKKIAESREPYEYHKGSYSKTLTCSYCGHVYQDILKRKLTLGPLFGEPQNRESIS